MTPVPFTLTQFSRSGSITFPPDGERDRFEQLVGADALHAVETLLQRRPELVHHAYMAWGEGVLSGPANRRRRGMIDLLMRYGARVPDVAKWGRAYYFKHPDIAALLLERGMNPNHMNWQRTTLLHDMMREGDIRKARLLLDHGAEVNAIDDEFRSTPLGAAGPGPAAPGAGRRPQSVGRPVGDASGVGPPERPRGPRNHPAAGGIAIAGRQTGVTRSRTMNNIMDIDGQWVQEALEREVHT